MDDFRVVSIPSSDPYNNRPPSGAIQRKREKQQDGKDSRKQEDADAFETVAADDDQSDAGEPIEDYYLPSDPSEAE